MKKLAEFYKSEGARLLGFIRSRTGNPEDAEDILGEVFLKILEAPNVIAPIENLGAWFYTAARNRIIDLYRSRGRRAGRIVREAEGAELDTLAADYGIDAEAEFERGLAEKALEAALEGLPAEQRDVFIRNELEGKTFREMARETGVPINTLMARKRYAVLALRKRLTDLKHTMEEV